MKLVFLDIDGVMTSTLETPGSYINHNENEYGASPLCVKRLIDLCEKTNSKIIISSNWRKFDSFGSHSRWFNPFTGKYNQNPMPKLIDQLGELYIGSLPKVRHLNKSQALKIWFDETELNVDNYVIFDDDLNEQFQESEFKNNFILTDFEIGLTDDDCEKALKILNK